jgi:LPXTG-motif cell wall-anchored protein
VTPDTADVGDPVRLTATAADASNIASAFYLVDGVPATSLSAEDGAFDEPSEALESAFISTASFAPGERTLCVVVTDAAGNQSDGTDCVTLILSPADDGPGDDDDDDSSDDDDDSSSDDDDDDSGGSSALPNTGATDASVTAGLTGLVAITVGGMLLAKTRMRPRHRA